VKSVDPEPDSAKPVCKGLDGDTGGLEIAERFSRTNDPDWIGSAIR
jgi:hypothetical protein